MKVADPGSGEGRYTKKTFFKFKSGTSLILRVLPPMGELAEKGQWNKYYAVHFGFRGTDGKMLLFQSPQQKDKMSGDVVVRDVALDRIVSKQEQQKKLKEALLQMASDSPKRPAVENALKEVNEFLEKYNLDKKNYINAIDLAGNIGALGLGYKDFNVLKDLREKLRQEEGIDIASVKGGIFLQFTKTGRGIDTVTTITPYLETIEENGRKMKQYKAFPITEELFPKLEKEAHDLSNMYPVVTAEQVEQMVAGGPAAVDIVKKMVYKRSESAEKPHQDAVKKAVSPNVDQEKTLNLDDMDSTVDNTSSSQNNADEENLLKDLGIDL